MPTGKILAVPAHIDIIDADKSQWAAIGIPGSGFGQLFAVGDTFADARRSFAEVAAVAVINGVVVVEDLEPTELGAVRVMATTRKTFLVADLDTGGGE
jgi:hypothetical protein